MFRSVVFLALCALLFALPAYGDTAGSALSAAQRIEAIEGVLRCVRENYVFPEIAVKMEAHLRAKMARREYDSITDGPMLAEALTRDLHSVQEDRHLHVSYSPSVLPKSEMAGVMPPPGWLAEMRTVLSRDNYGFAKVEILPGNIGYIQTTYFAPPEIAGEAYVATMNFVANTDALIIDLRGSNGSMSEDALPMLCGYFFERSVHLNDFYWRSTDQTRQTWTLAHVPGKKYLNKPIYILTSGKTFSGAEELAYDLKNLKRATLVGDTTGGGANGGGDIRAADHFSVFVPNGRAINPITKTNWEGVGVAPDVPVPALHAKDRAYLMALKQSLETSQDAEWKNQLSGIIKAQEAKQSAFKKVTFRLAGYPNAKSVSVAGTFNFWAIRANPLTRKGNVWEGEVELEPGRHTYKFVIDDAWITDPANPVVEKEGQYTNSVLIVP